MANEILMFDLLAKDSASGAFRDMATQAAAAAAEMHAAFAAPIEAKVETSGFDGYIAKLDEVKQANEAGISRLQADSEKLSQSVQKSIADADALLGKYSGGAPTRFDRMHASINRLVGDGLPKLENFARRVSMMAPLGMAASGAGAVVGAGVLAGTGGLLSMLTAGAGAGGILGLSVEGSIHGYSKLQAQVVSLRSSMRSMTQGSTAWIRDQARLTSVLDKQREKYGPIVAGVHGLHHAWAGFMQATSHSSMKLIGEGLKIVNDALKQFAPVANAAAKALLPVMDNLDQWVKGPGFAKFMSFLQTEGPKALTDMVKFLGNMGSAFLSAMEAMSPLAKGLGNLMAHMNGKEFLVFAGAIGALVAVMMGVTAPVLGVVAGVVALGAAFLTAWSKSASFRNGVKGDLAGVVTAFDSLKTAASAFWAKWGADITKFGVNFLKNSVGVIAHTFDALAHVIAAVLDLLTGNWHGFGQNLLKAAEDIGKGLLNIWHGLVAPMLTAGKHIIEGLWHGIEDAAGSLLSKAGSLAHSFISKFAGPFHFGSPSKLFRQYGQWIIDGLTGGISSRRAELNKLLSEVTKDITNVDHKIAAAESWGAAFKGNVFSAGLSTVGTKNTTGLVNGVLTTTSTTAKLSNAQILAEMKAYEHEQLAQSKVINADVSKLAKEGLSKNLLSQLQSAGAAGLPYLEALAAASKAEVKTFNSLNAKVNRNLNDAGYAATGGHAQKLHAQRQRLSAEKRMLESVLKNLTVTVRGSKLRPVG